MLLCEYIYKVVEPLIKKWRLSKSKYLLSITTKQCNISNLNLNQKCLENVILHYVLV